MRPRAACAAFAALLACFAATTPIAQAQAAGRNVTFRFAPTARAQIAISLESSDGARFATVRLTDAVARRGIGNRPGASQMNSGYHWPLGRREGVLPVWAHRRAAAPGAMLFTRVIFQDRPEGYAIACAGRRRAIGCASASARRRPMPARTPTRQRMPRPTLAMRGRGTTPAIRAGRRSASRG